MTTTDTKAPAYTYTPRARPYEAISMDTGKLATYYQSSVLRSDGVEVWIGQGYRTARSAQPQANMTAGRLRAYLAEKGVCWHDVQQAVRNHKKSRDALRLETLKELRDAISAGLTQAMNGDPEEGLPYGEDTAQGITATQAFRLMRDRLADWTEEHPQPVQP